MLPRILIAKLKRIDKSFYTHFTHSKTTVTDLVNALLSEGKIIIIYAPSIAGTDERSEKVYTAFCEVVALINKSNLTFSIHQHENTFTKNEKSALQVTITLV